MIKNPSGLHARQASMFVNMAKSFKSSIFIEKEGKKVNAKSMMAVMMLGVKQGDEIVLIGDGEDAQYAINELEQLVNSGIGETIASKRLIKKSHVKFNIKEFVGDGSGVGIFYFNGEIYHSFANHSHAIEEAAKNHKLTIDEITEMDIKGEIPIALGYMHNSINTIVMPPELRNISLDIIKNDILQVLPDYNIIGD